MHSVLRPRYLLLALVIFGLSLPLLQRAATAHSAQNTTAPSADATHQHAATDTMPAPASSTVSGNVPGPAARDVIAAMQALPADFQADVLLRISSSTDIPLNAGDNHAAAALRLVQQSSTLAEHAQRRMPGMASVGYIREEIADELHAPFTAGLDRLSLQTRAAQLMPSAQREALFASLPTPQAATCDTPYLDDPSPTYTLASALQPSQPAARAAALAKRIDAAQHETDVAPALKMVLAGAPLEPAGQTQLADSLVRMFDRIRNDDPGFTATELSVAGDIPPLLLQLQDPALRERLHRAYRGYVTAHLTQTRCPASLLGNHWMLEQLYVAELPDERVVEAPPADAPSLDDQAVSLIRQAGHNIRTQLLDPSVRGDDADVEKASMEFLDQLDQGVLQQTATNDSSGRLQRARLRELLRYLEYAPAGAARDRGMGILAPLLSGPYYAHDHDTWFGDLRVVANQLQRWPDRDQRLVQLVEHADPVVKVYAMLMQRRQFP